jgi:hypothetical protein
MFAVSRTASVPGLIMFLIVSIIAMNVISIVGVPCDRLLGVQICGLCF